MYSSDERLSLNGTENSVIISANQPQLNYVLSSAMPVAVSNHTGIQTTTTQDSANRIPNYENMDGNVNNTTPVTSGYNINNNGHATHYKNSENQNVGSQEIISKPAQSKLRVSFDEDSNMTQFTEHYSKNYEDVLTLRVPSKEHFWQSRSFGRRRRGSRLKCSNGSTSDINSTSSFLFWRKSRHRKTHDEDTNFGAKSNGNHLDSMYENEGDEIKEKSNEWIGKSAATITSINANLIKQDAVNPRSYRALESDNETAEKSGLDQNANSMVWTTNFLAALSILLIILTFPFSLIYCIRIVAEYERAVVLRMGNLIPKGKGTKGPGLFFILPCIDSVRKVDLRTITFAIPPQELLTRDSVTVSVDAVVYYRVLNPVASVLNIEDAARSTRLLAQTTIRNVLGTKDLAQILMDRDEISTLMQSSLDATTDAWGVKVERVEIKDVRLPIQLQRAMAAEAEAAREARAKVIAATGEQEAARSLKKAARVIATSPMAFQLRYLQTLCAISAEKNSTIFFPVPIDIMQNLGDFGSCGSYGTASKLSKISGWMRTQTKTVKAAGFSYPDNKSDVNSVNTVENQQHSLKKNQELLPDTIHAEPQTDESDELISPNLECGKDDIAWTHDEAEEHSDTV